MSGSKQKTTSNQTTNQTATTTPNTPDWLQQPWQGYTGKVTDLMNSGQSLVAGPSNLQNQAFQGAANLAPSQNYDWATQLGLGAGLAGANMAGPAAQGAAGSASSRNITDLDLNAYLNAGLGDQITAAQADYDATGGRVRAAQSGQAALNGGSRNSNNAVMQAITEGELSRAANTGLAGIRANAYDQAGNLATNDLNREASVSTANAGFATQANLANAGATNSMNQFNASQQDNALARMLQSAGLLENVGQAQGADERANIGIQFGLGQEQRDIANQTSEASNLAMIQALLSGVPLSAFVGQTSTGNSTSNGTQTQTSTPSLLSQIGQGASTAASVAALFSDRRLKTDIEPVRKDGRGRQWYRYRYLWDEPGTVHEGVMAQEVMATDPQAVGERDGFMTVNYSMLEAA